MKMRRPCWRHEKMKRVFAIIHVACVLFGAYVIWQRLGSTCLSTLVTFSNQVNVLSALSCLVSLFSTQGTWIQDLLMLYNALIAIVFYALIVPLNGVSTHTADAIVHAVTPIAFYMTWRYNKKSEVFNSRIAVFLYPALYFWFALYVSYRRGYMLYPLFNPFGVGAVLAIIEILRVSLKNLKS